MSSRVSVLSGLVSLLSFVAAPLALAQPVEPGKPCAADVQKLCPGVKPGHGAILACLEPKQDQISPACKEVVKAKLTALKEACDSDVQKFCAGVPAGTGKIMQCLKKNSAELSDTCKAQWAKTKPAPPPAN
jgi:hypothetical protein